MLGLFLVCSPFLLETQGLVFIEQSLLCEYRVLQKKCNTFQSIINPTLILNGQSVRVMMGPFCPGDKTSIQLFFQKNLHQMRKPSLDAALLCWLRGTILVSDANDNYLHSLSNNVDWRQMVLKSLRTTWALPRPYLLDKSRSVAPAKLEITLVSP